MTYVKNVVLLSGGVSSWAAGKRVAEAEGTEGLFLLFTDTLTEDESTYRFLTQSAEDIGGEFIWLKDPQRRDIWRVMRDEKMLANSRFDPCSKILKRQPARKWIEKWGDPEVTKVHLGISWDEAHRFDRAERYWEPFTVTAPLIDPPLLFKDDLIDQAKAAGLELPELYGMGFPHANCGGGCVKAGIGHWRQVHAQLPEVFDRWEMEEQKMRDYLGKDVAMLTDRTGGERKPLPLSELRRRIESDDESIEQAKFDFGGCGCMVVPGDG